ncbi:MAG: lipoprotein, partial [Paludibacteraceae bacterium]|nr:lipoprotein [Paludibacteraceae bacterium]
MKKSVIFLLVAFVLTACSSTNRLTLSVVEPAEVTIHPSIKKVGIINR